MNHESSIGLALGSGGVRGFAHLGVLEVLEREGLTPDFIAGSSVGAAIGAMYAFRPKLVPNLTHVQNYLNSDLYDNTKLGYLKQSEESRNTIYDKLRVRFAKGAVLATSMARESLFDEQTLHGNVAFLVPPVNIEDAMIPLAVVCFDLDTGEEIVLEQGPLIEAVMASCAIPGVFPAVEQGGRQLMDGGVVNPVPCDRVRAMGADIVIGVDVTPQLPPLQVLNGSYEVAMRAADVSKHRLKSLKLREADLVVQVDTSEVFWGDFTRFGECVDKGREAAERALPEIKQLVAVGN